MNIDQLKSMFLKALQEDAEFRSAVVEILSREFKKEMELKTQRQKQFEEILERHMREYKTVLDALAKY